MKVDSTTSSSARTLSNASTGASAGAARTQSGPTAATGGAAGAAGAPAGDANVNLSGLSSNLRALAASGSADIDTAQVESIRDAIRNGTLSIDAGKIADGVLQTAHELLQNGNTPSTGN
ncbi:flagellar biosynthesis anti-sigma factor FlgM [Burkholderia alba]|uniref:flagellar biosynthesis anti-sigma factor FlgM n=1 Tax=Burkholderia alba TaxID=2683677 RepID=UPI002B0554F1|nr:flagellar biosynthesis anti-sigma factor FlgM [Burkholderia alba]